MLQTVGDAVVELRAEATRRGYAPGYWFRQAADHLEGACRDDAANECPACYRGAACAKHGWTTPGPPP